MHIFISGDQGVGKTTLIRSLLERSTQKIYGFCTEKKGDSVFFHSLSGCLPDEMDENFVYRETNRIGHLQGGEMTPMTNVFEQLGINCLRSIPEESFVVCDEIGFLESEAYRFQRILLELLEKNHRIIAALKSRRTLFLDQLRDNKGALQYAITTENRKSLQEQILHDILKDHRWGNYLLCKDIGDKT